MATQVFHFSKTGVSSGQGFYLKEGQSSILLRNLVLDSNSLISGNNLVYNNGNQTISGVKTFASHPTVNNTGVLLSGQNSFTITLTHSSSSPSIGLNYFGINDIAMNSAANGALRRRIPIAETCQIRKASWTHLVGVTGNPVSILSTGYVINTSSTPPQTGIVSAVIDSASDTFTSNFITTFSPPINVTSGDLIVAALGVTGFITAPTQVRNTVIVYCYN